MKIVSSFELFIGQTYRQRFAFLEVLSEPKTNFFITSYDCMMILLCLLKTGSVVAVAVVISGQVSAGTRANVSIARPPCTQSRTS